MAVDTLNLVHKDYRIPVREAKDDVKLGWIRSAVEEGSNFLKGQIGWEDIDRGMDIIAGADEETVPSTLSGVYSNRLKRQIREVVATMSNLRPLIGFTSDNEKFLAQANANSKLMMGWWQGTFADRDIRSCMQWACGSGTGYVSPIWEPDFWVMGRGDVKLYSYGARDILPIQIGRDHDIQKAYAIIIQTELPIARAHAIWPEYADKLRPDRQASSWFNRSRKSGRRAIPRFFSPVYNALFGDKEDVSTSGPVIDLFNIYILDTTLNNSLKPVEMGDPGTKWHYQVPFMGQDIPMLKSPDGTWLNRKARREDCLLYPFRRLIVATNKVVLSDNSSPFWHGKVPLVKFTVDDWPNQYLGFSLVRDGLPLQRSMTKLLRGIDDWAQKRVRPDVLYDANAYDKSFMDQFDPRKPAQKIPVRNSLLAKPFEVVVYPDMPNWLLEHFKILQEELDHNLAVRDMTALARANQIPGAESIERLKEMMGPIVNDISRNQERSIWQLGEMVKTLFYEFYDTPRKVKLLGHQGLLEEDFTFTPDMLIPSGFAEDEKNPLNLLPFNVERAKRARDCCIFQITQGSTHQITQMAKKLLYLQLKRSNFKIDSQTLAEALDLPNWGALPGNPSTILERWKAESQMDLELEAQKMAFIQELTGGQVPGGAGSGAGGKNPPGRQPSGQKPPAMTSKDGGTRPVIKES